MGVYMQIGVFEETVNQMEGMIFQRKKFTPHYIREALVAIVSNYGRESKAKLPLVHRSKCCHA